ncbi:MAG: hypothetical protein ABFD49_00545 [Armatimonadota bacterium]|nr:hypothetical protein [bacterium]
MNRLRIVNEAFIVMFATIVAALTPAFADIPVVGTETPICPTFGAAPGNQVSASVAAGSNGYLMVWSDSRGDDADIFACRISADGEVLDTLGISVCSYSGKQVTPDVAWNGTEYLVVWGDKRGSLQHIYGARVRPDGEVLDTEGFLISGSTGGQFYPKVAGESSGWLVVWQDTKGSSEDIYGCKVNVNGTLGSIYGISTRSDNEQAPDVAYNGTTYFVVWRDYRNYASTDTDIYGCRVSKLGVRMASDILVSCTSSSSTTGAPGIQLSPSICTMGNTCFVVWEDYRNSTTDSDVYGTRVTSAAVISDKGGIAISTESGGGELPAVGYDGNRLLAVWRNGTSRLLRGARISSSGSVLDSTSLTIYSGMAGSTCGCVDGLDGDFVAGWNSLSVTDTDVLSTLVTDSGSVASPAGVTTSMALDDEDNYSVVDNGSEYAVVWSQTANGSKDIMAARLSYSGEPLNETPVNITSTYSGDQVEPSIAWNGSKYLVVWSGNESYSATEWDIRGWFLNSDLNLLSTSPITISAATEDQAMPSVASNGSNFLVVWEDSRSAVSPTYYTDIYGAIVSSSGTVTATSPAISPATGCQYNPKAASNGTDYFVVWEDYRNLSYPLIYGTRVTSAAVVKDSSGVALPKLSYYQTGPNICYGGGCYFVVWSDYYQISGCRVSTAGALIDSSGIAIDSGSKIKLHPSACWDGTGYRVVWEDYRSSDSTNSDVYYTTVSYNGTVSSSPTIALVSDLKPQLFPAVFFSGGEGILTYSRLFNHSNCACCVTLLDRSVKEVDSIAQARSLPTGTTVALADKIVTAVFSGYFYIEDMNRASGIRVVSDMSVTRDSLIDVVGAITISDGERQINCTEAYEMGVASDPPGPLGMRGDFLGGSDLNDYTPGITGANGPNNIGLLVKTWGPVTSATSTYFYIEAKPGTYVKVISNSLTEPGVGDFVTVTGISSCEVISGSTSRAILPRDQDDIVVLE